MYVRSQDLFSLLQKQRQFVKQLTGQTRANVHTYQSNSQARVVKRCGSRREKVMFMDKNGGWSTLTQKRQKKEEKHLSSGKSISETKKCQTIDKPNVYQFAGYQSFL